MRSPLVLYIKIGLCVLCGIWLTVARSILKSSIRPETKNYAADFDRIKFFRGKITSKHESPSLESKILSRASYITVTSDVRGNLGPASVIIQNPPGNDWIKDRWQAAGDMHGTAIPGHHWVMLDFETNAVRIITKVVIDWEAAYSNDYQIEISTGEQSHEDSNLKWCTLYDGGNESQESRRHVEEYGQSPGVKKKTPLHVEHTIDMKGAQDNCASFRFVRVFIKSPAKGWGVSIWELDVHGLLSNSNST